MNIWTWILDGVIWLVENVLLPLAFGSTENAYSAFNFASITTSSTYLVFQMLYISFSFFDLTLVGVYFLFLFGVKTVQLILTVWYFVKSLFPAGGY